MHCGPHIIGKSIFDQCLDTRASSAIIVLFTAANAPLEHELSPLPFNPVLEIRF